jgi:hypothetical protein
VCLIFVSQGWGSVHIRPNGALHTRRNAAAVILALMEVCRSAGVDRVSRGRRRGVGSRGCRATFEQGVALCPKGRRERRRSLLSLRVRTGPPADPPWMKL